MLCVSMVHAHNHAALPANVKHTVKRDICELVLLTKKHVTSEGACRWQWQRLSSKLHLVDTSDGTEVASLHASSIRPGTPLQDLITVLGSDRDSIWVRIVVASAMMEVARRRRWVYDV